MTPAASPIDRLEPGIGKRTRLHRLLYKYGPANGTLLFLPIDQGMEHGPRDFFANPESADPEFQLRLALEGGFSGIVLQVGLARKYMNAYAGRVPLILKLNGKTDVPADAEAFSPLIASVEEAVELGAEAVGYTVYVGSPSQDRDFVQFMGVRQAAERLGMPVIVWAYPRGEAIERKGGRDSLYAVDYAARVASELGADVVKLNYPKPGPSQGAPQPYDSLDLPPEEGIRKVVQSAGRAMVLVSGGERVGDQELVEKVRHSMEAGAAGLIFGRNLWQRPWDQALEITRRIRELLEQYSR